MIALKSLKELERYLHKFKEFYKSYNNHSIEEITPDFLKNYAEQHCERSGPNFKKAVGWSLLKFGSHLAILQVVQSDPARNLIVKRFLHERSP